MTGQADIQKGCRNDTRGERQCNRMMSAHMEDEGYMCRSGEGEALLRMLGGRETFEARGHTELWEIHHHRGHESLQQNCANIPHCW